MATWRRCPKTFFYVKTTRDARMDKNAESFDRTYVDPADMVLVRTMPWHFYEPDRKAVTVLRWVLQDFDAAVKGDDISPEQSAILEAWAGRILGTLDGVTDRQKKWGLLEDLDVDMHERDQLLDVIELMVNVSPPGATALDHFKVPPTREAVAGLLFTLGIGSC